MMQRTTPPQALANIQAINPYVPGKPIEELQREFGIDNIIKLASNENPLGLSPRAQSAMEKAFGESARYPDGNGFNLKSAIIRHFAQRENIDIDFSQIVLGNGSNDLLELAGRIFLQSADRAVMSQYSFAIYPLVGQSCNAQNIIVPVGEDFQQDLTAMSEAVRHHRAKIVFLANPNNPTGVWLPAPTIKQWIESIPTDCAIVLDEAYSEFLDGDDQKNANLSLTWLAQHPNLIITRTFSKIYGLGGMRVGYALAHPQVADWMNRLRQPFNVNHMALCAATAAIDDDDFVNKSRANNSEQMRLLVQALPSMGYTIIPSHGNFIAFNAGDGAKINLSLLRQGVIVRPLASYGLPQWLRVTIGTPTENQRFLNALAQSALH